MKRRMKTALLFLGALTVVFLAACSNNDEINSSNKGSLKIFLTDAPFPSDDVSEVNIVIDEVSIRKSDDTGTAEDESGWMKLPSEKEEFNLLNLQNGAVALLADTSEIAMGTYNEIRLHIVSAEVVLKTGETFDLKIPSGTSSGLKIKINEGLVVRGGNPSALILDFDVSRSFLVQGNPGKQGVITGFKFKPVIRATAEDISGTLEGKVATIGKSVVDPNQDSTIYLSGAQVMITSSKDTAIAMTNENGYYAVIGLLPDSYKVVGSKEGFVNDTIPSVSVTTNQVTQADLILNPVPVEVPVTGGEPAGGGN